MQIQARAFIAPAILLNPCARQAAGALALLRSNHLSARSKRQVRPVGGRIAKSFVPFPEPVRNSKGDYFGCYATWFGARAMFPTRHPRIAGRHFRTGCTRASICGRRARIFSARLRIFTNRFRTVITRFRTVTTRFRISNSRARVITIRFAAIATRARAITHCARLNTRRASLITDRARMETRRARPKTRCA